MKQNIIFRNPFIAALFLATLLIGCNTETSTTTTTTDTVNEESKIDEKAPTSLEFLLAEGMIKVRSSSDVLETISIGADISATSKDGILEKGILENGEGIFDVWYIKDNEFGTIGYIMPIPLGGSEIGSITITSDKVTTVDGFKVGTTWGEILAKHPTVEVHGSEIESRTHATLGNIYYRLDYGSIDYNLDRNEIPTDSKVIQITWL